MKNNSAIQKVTVTPASHEDISQRARELWEGYGRPEGRDEQIWLEAESQLAGVKAQPKAEPASAPAVEPSTKSRTRAEKPATAAPKPAAAPALARAKR